MTISREERSNIAQEVVRKEAAAVARLSGFIDEQFISALELILNSKGRLIITGIGKSAIIALLPMPVTINLPLLLNIKLSISMN